MKNSKRLALLAVFAGSLLVSGGCLNRIMYQAAVQVMANAIGGFVPDFTGGLGG